LALGEEFAQAFGVEIVLDDAVEAGLYGWILVVAHSGDEKLLERLALEHFAENIEHGVGAEGLALLLKFLEEAEEDLALASAVGDEIP
jgi:hypothetical protein